MKKHAIRNLMPHVYNLSDKSFYVLYGFWLGYEWWIKFRKI